MLECGQQRDWLQWEAAAQIQDGQTQSRGGNSKKLGSWAASTPRPQRGDVAHPSKVVNPCPAQPSPAQPTLRLLFSLFLADLGRGLLCPALLCPALPEHTIWGRLISANQSNCRKEQQGAPCIKSGSILYYTYMCGPCCMSAQSAQAGSRAAVQCSDPWLESDHTLHSALPSWPSPGEDTLKLRALLTDEFE